MVHEVERCPEGTWGSLLPSATTASGRQALGKAGRPRVRLWLPRIPPRGRP